jgi:hypothetical protein
MTTITRPGTEGVRHASLRDLVRNWAVGLAGLVRHLGRRIADMAASQHLGKDNETEIGRWTGARV